MLQSIKLEPSAGREDSEARRRERAITQYRRRQEDLGETVIGEAADWVVDLLKDLTINGVSAALAFVLGVLYLESSSRRLFRMRTPTRVTVVVAASAESSTGIYRRTSTGIGQVRAVAALTPKFSLAYCRRRLRSRPIRRAKFRPPFCRVVSLPDLVS